MSKYAKVILAAICMNGSVNITKEENNSVLSSVEFGFNPVSAEESSYLDGDEEACEQAQMESNRMFNSCDYDVKKYVAEVHKETCIKQNDYSVDVSFEIGAKVINGSIGSNLDFANYNKCKNQLDYERDYFIASCRSASNDYKAKRCT